jgi:hypothetical protein
MKSITTASCKPNKKVSKKLARLGLAKKGFFQ